MRAASQGTAADRQTAAVQHSPVMTRSITSVLIVGLPDTLCRSRDMTRVELEQLPTRSARFAIGTVHRM